jgi:hypothetical protein
MQNIFKIKIKLMRVKGSRTSVLYSKATAIANGNFFSLLEGLFNMQIL